MVFGIVQGHQGFLTIDSDPANGTRVGLFLPRLLDAVDVPGSSPMLGPGVLEPESTPGRSILVIDDEEVVLDVMHHFLQIAGHSVTCVAQETMHSINWLPADRWT